MKKTTTVLFASLVVSGSGLQAAQADAGNPFDVYALTGRSLHVNSGSCRSIPVSAKVNAPSDYQDIYAEVDVWRGATYLGSASLEGSGASRRLTGSYFYCPNLDGVGTFRLGESEVSWDQYDDDFNYYYSGDFTDVSRGSVVVKQATRVALTGTRRGQVRRFHAAGRYFGVGGSGWYKHPKGVRMTLQRRPSNTGAWKRVQVARTNMQGTVNFRIRAKGVYAYRIVSAGTQRSWPGISRVLSR